MIASALELTCDAIPATMGIMTHEYLHTFELIDLYDYTFEGKGVGTFDIMAYPYGNSNDGYLPNSLSVWAKTAIDWLTCQDVTTSGTYTLKAAALAADCIKIQLQPGESTEDGKSKEEYLLIENRQQLGFDVELWKSGVVIYHIDNAADEQYARGFPGQGGWPGNGVSGFTVSMLWYCIGNWRSSYHFENVLFELQRHYQVAVLQADGLYEMEKNENNGNEGDIFVSGMSLGPNQDGNTYPNTDMYQGGDIKKSGVVIDIGDQTGTDFQITITFQGKSAADESENKPISSFAAPKKEPPPEEAQEQFRTPDAQEYRISGKIPQLAWYDEQEQQEAQARSSAAHRWRALVSFGAIASVVVAAL
jgi:hypothetical protein